MSGLVPEVRHNLPSSGPAVEYAGYRSPARRSPREPGVPLLAHSRDLRPGPDD
ncbi:MAG: hypothetical protein ACXQTN_05050 [Methanoculleaceae archaeon]